MRRLERKTLEELAKERPVISEKEQSALIGGTVYYDLSGSLLGTVGASDEIRVITKENWNEYQNGVHEPNHDYSQMGTPLSLIDNDTTKVIIASRYISGRGFLGVQINSDITLANGAQAGIDPNNPSVVLIQHDSMILNHEHDLINTLQHEQYHLTGIINGYQTSEIDAIQYQISQSSYASTTNAYKMMTGDYLYAQWEKMGIAGTEGHYKLDAYKTCGVVL